MSSHGPADSNRNLDSDKAKDVRNEMHTYWKNFSSKGDVNEMIVDSKAEEIAKSESQEIMSSIPNYKGKDVLELGSGIGLDVILTNWLLEYLTEEDVEKLLKRMIQWLRPDGRLFFRETCMQASGDAHFDNNPTIYRPPYEYADIFRRVTQEKKGVNFGLDLILTKSLDTYIRIKNNPNQNCWLLRISERHGDEQQRQTDALQKLLDENIYPSAEIQCLEEVFGEGFTGPMIPDKELYSMLDLKKGQSLLEVGSGTGTSAIRMSQNSAVNTTGIDLSLNMSSIAKERLTENKIPNVRFEVSDVRVAHFDVRQFDTIFSKECLSHIERKDLLFMDFLKWVKVGGKLIFVDFATCGPPESLSLALQNFMRTKQFYYITTEQYILELRKAGFSNVRAIDKTEIFIQQMKEKLARLVDQREYFSKKYTQHTWDAVKSLCDDKLQKCVEGSLKWTIFYAEKVPRGRTAQKIQ